MILIGFALVLFWYVLRGSFIEFTERAGDGTGSLDSHQLAKIFSSFIFWDSFCTRFFVAIVLAWVFMFGASIGSFLNVVVYRMPLGRSLYRRGSYCPYCHQPILLRDNIPVFGWINLHGRCRQCRLPISVRTYWI